MWEYAVDFSQRLRIKMVCRDMSKTKDLLSTVERQYGQNKLQLMRKIAEASMRHAARAASYHSAGLDHVPTKQVTSHDRLSSFPQHYSHFHFALKGIAQSAASVARLTAVSCANTMMRLLSSNPSHHPAPPTKKAASKSTSLWQRAKQWVGRQHNPQPSTATNPTTSPLSRAWQRMRQLWQSQPKPKSPTSTELTTLGSRRAAEEKPGSGDPLHDARIASAKRHAKQQKPPSKWQQFRAWIKAKAPTTLPMARRPLRKMPGPPPLSSSSYRASRATTQPKASRQPGPSMPPGPGRSPSPTEGESKMTPKEALHAARAASAKRYKKPSRTSAWWQPLTRWVQKKRAAKTFRPVVVRPLTAQARLPQRSPTVISSSSVARPAQPRLAVEHPDAQSERIASERQAQLERMRARLAKLEADSPADHHHSLPARLASRRARKEGQPAAIELSTFRSRAPLPVTERLATFPVETPVAVEPAASLDSRPADKVFEHPLKQMQRIADEHKVGVERMKARLAALEALNPSAHSTASISTDTHAVRPTGKAQPTKTPPMHAQRSTQRKASEPTKREQKNQHDIELVRKELQRLVSNGITFDKDFAVNGKLQIKGQTWQVHNLTAERFPLGGTRLDYRLKRLDQPTARVTDLGRSAFIAKFMPVRKQRPRRRISMAQRRAMLRNPAKPKPSTRGSLSHG